MEPYSEFGDLINEYLMTREMSGAQLARRLGVSTSTVNRWRNGQTRPESPEQVIRLADLLGTYGETRGRLLQSVGYGAVVDASNTLSSGDEVTPNANEEQPVAISIRYPTDTSTWQQYPSTYRQAEMTILAKWIEIGASGVVQGLAGCGVSTLLRYFCNRPEVVSTDYSSNKQIIMPVWIDLHPLTEPIVPTLYRLLLRSVLESAYRLTDQLPSELLRECEAEMDDTDSFNLQTTIFRLFSHCQSNQIKVVAVLV